MPAIPKRVLTRLRHALTDRNNTAALLIFALNLFLVSAVFLPNLREINAWDEAVQVNSGRLLLQGELPNVAGNPLVSAFYALTYLPFAKASLWLVHSTSLGRLLLYSLVWLGAYAVGRQLVPWSHALVMAGLLLASAIPASLLSFPSDALYVGLAALGLSQALAYLRLRDRKRLWFASALLGLAGLARNDGLVVGVAFTVASLALAGAWRERGRLVLASGVPFLAIVGGYLLIYGARTGHFELGTMARTYDNFEAGQQVIYSGEGQINPVLEAKLEARRFFGTADENRGSVFRAILRNPAVYQQRLLAVVRALPAQLLTAYGVRLAIPTFLLAARGLVHLIRKARYRLLLLLAVWSLPLLSGFVITLFRIGHLRFPFYVVFALAAVGLAGLIDDMQDSRGRAAWIALLLLLGLYGFYDQKLAISYGTLALLTAFLLGWLWIEASEDRRMVQAVPALLLLGAAILMHGDYSGPKLRVLGEAPDERAVLYLTEHFPPGARIAAGSPGPIYTAGMTYMGLTSLDVPRTTTSAEFLEWMHGQGIHAVYVDHSLSSENPLFWQQIESLIGHGLDRDFVADQGDFQVLLVNK